MDAVTIIRHLLTIKQYAIGSFAIALYEYMITLDREVEKFWKRKFTFATALWLLNRYTLLVSLFPTAIGFIFYPYSEEVCLHFVKFPGAMQIVSNIASGITLSLRVYALYGQARWVLAVLLPVFMAEIGLEAWALAGGVPAMFPAGVIGCILTGKQDQGNRFAAFWIGQLVFPSLIFIMTLVRVLRMQHYGSLKGSLLTVMLRDGIMYFLAIFMANLTNVLTYTIAPEDLKFVNAPFTNVITTLMICRLMLNLRRSEHSPGLDTNMISRFSAYPGATQSELWRAYLGDLGGDMDIVDLNDRHDRKREAELVDAKNAHRRGQSEEESESALDTILNV